jgi:uncharacterized cupin superfamily protein
MNSPQIARLSRAVALSRWDDMAESEVASGTRQQFGHIFVDDKELNLTIGLWRAEANLSHWGAYPHDEFITVLEGEVRLEERDRVTVIGLGESAVIPKGCECRWSQPGRLTKAFAIFAGAGAVEGTPRVVKIDPQAPLATSVPPAPGILLSPLPHQEARTDIETSGGQFSAGVWRSAPYARSLITYGRHELMHVVAGRFTMTDDAGNSQTYAAGDTLLVPRGNRNAWTSTTAVTKIFCSIEPRAC